MGAKEKLDRLKLEWIVYAFAVAILSLLQDGFDSDSLLSAALRVAITFGLATYVTRSLDQRSSLIWAFGVTFGLLGAIGAAIEIVAYIVEAADGGDFQLIALLLAIASGYMHLKVFRVLRDPDVKRHVMLD